jgi:TRAP-type mannitol/chloroaromatic compound transport system permease small subunit
MNAWIRITDRIGTWMAWASGLILFATAVLIAIEVVLRKIFTISMGGADEISYYALAVSSSWTFGYALLRKAHIRIDVLYIRMSGKIRIALDLLALTLFGACAAIATYFSFFVLQTSIRRGSVANTPLGTPLWIPQSLWFAGLVFLCLVILVLLIGTIYRTLRKDARGAHELSGASSLLEEIKEETGKQARSLNKGETP